MSCTASLQSSTTTMPELEPMDDAYLNGRVFVEDGEPLTLPKLEEPTLQEILGVLRTSTVKCINAHLTKFATANDIPKSYYMTVEDKELHNQKLSCLYDVFQHKRQN